MSEKKERYYFVVLKGRESLAWSNSMGWVKGEEFDIFTEEEKNSMMLPIGGEWREADNI